MKSNKSNLININCKLHYFILSIYHFPNQITQDLQEREGEREISAFRESRKSLFLRPMAEQA